MKKRNWLEATVTAISALMVAGVFGILIYQILYRSPTEPDIVITLGIPTAASQHFTLPVEVRNSGTKTAENVRIEISYKKENSLLEFDYIPGESVVSGHAVFSQKPERDSLQSKVLGYIIP